MSEGKLIRRHTDEGAMRTKRIPPDWLDAESIIRIRRQFFEKDKAGCVALGAGLCKTHEVTQAEGYLAA